MVETRLVGRAQVCVGAERSDRGGFRFKSSFLYFRQELIAVPVRQTNVAQNDIERISHIARTYSRAWPQSRRLSKSPRTSSVSRPREIRAAAPAIFCVTKFSRVGVTRGYTEFRYKRTSHTIAGKLWPVESRTLWRIHKGWLEKTAFPRSAATPWPARKSPMWKRDNPSPPAADRTISGKRSVAIANLLRGRLRNLEAQSDMALPRKMIDLAGARLSKDSAKGRAADKSP